MSRVYTVVRKQRLTIKVTDQEIVDQGDDLKNFVFEKAYDSDSYDWDSYDYEVMGRFDLV